MIDNSIDKSRVKFSVHFLFIVLLLLFIGCGSERVSPPSKPPFPMVTDNKLFAVDALDQQHAWMVGFNSTAHNSGNVNTFERSKKLELL